MKTFQTFGKLFLTASAVLLSACSSDDNNNGTPVNPNPVPANASYVKGKVDGASFTSLIFGTSTATCSRSGTGSGAYITILGGDMAANSITVYLHGIATVGTHTVNSGTDSLLNYSPGSGEFAYNTGNCDAASGTINITAVDETHIEGTFSFVGKDTEDCSATKTITEGSFKGVFPSS
jgi:uncharacterized protein DUF6252